ncbi:MAG: Crp/Fnr family transcriptional regulator [Clostridium sp.]|nr:Crp/Fnr family transcriptional regulator [Clostridium sp.]
MDYITLFDFWKDLSKTQQQTLSASIYEISFENGRIVNDFNKSCKGIFAVKKGELRAFIVSPEGREITLYKVLEGEVCVLAASCLMDSIAFDILIEAVSDTEVYLIPSKQLNNVMEENPKVGLYIYKSATEKFTKVMWTMQQLLFMKVDERIANFILDETPKQNSNIIKVTQDEIAKQIGSAREVVSRILKYFVSEGILSLKRGQIEVLDKDKLKNMIKNEF